MAKRVWIIRHESNGTFLASFSGSWAPDESAAVRFADTDAAGMVLDGVLGGRGTLVPVDVSVRA